MWTYFYPFSFLIFFVCSYCFAVLFSFCFHLLYFRSLFFNCIAYHISLPNVRPRQSELLYRFCIKRCCFVSLSISFSMLLLLLAFWPKTKERERKKNGEQDKFNFQCVNRIYVMGKQYCRIKCV